MSHWLSNILITYRRIFPNTHKRKNFLIFVIYLNVFPYLFIAVQKFIYKKIFKHDMVFLFHDGLVFCTFLILARYADFSLLAEIYNYLL